MTESEWLAEDHPHTMLEFLRGTASRRKLRLLAVACCSRTKPFIEDDYHELADIAEAFAEGQATAEDMKAVRDRHQLSNDFPDRDAFYNTTAPDIGAEIGGIVEDLADWVAHCSLVKKDLESKEWKEEKSKAFARELALVTVLIRDLFGNPFRPVSLAPAWLTPNVVALASTIYDERAFDRLPILADALMDAGCDNEDILSHLRSPGPHVRGCWVIDLLLGKE